MPSSPAGVAPSEEVGAASDDITSIDDLGPLEANLGLEKDPNRTRSEGVVKAGPCYQRMAASDRSWNMRRYTKGAAFFFTTAAGEPLDPVACVDVDVMHNNAPATMALSGLSLDIVQRFQLGRFNASASFIQAPGGSGPAMFSFANGAIELRAGAYEETDDAPTYSGGQFSASIEAIDSKAFPRQDIVAPYPSVRLLMPDVANLAYRIAKADPGLPISKDAIGRFVSVEDTTAPVGDEFNTAVHFEKVDITCSYTATGDHERNWLDMTDRATGRLLLACVQIVDGPGGEDAPYECK